ncbi:Manganese transport system ATP-binding protein MntB [Austwickia sp. TVS 96-490-7B]|uniref:metal ABC transporter ATP-binding protein n=1 Tax=Austwickia sp. TVS 96-490-7B TaxID=2830843 RepID=UPI001D5E9631|nr:metal ABC transporter ATP-binding protein [Austwickia sp. TVS 96-490-7B]MBW3084806.1 Manganese transport system ATP-binding protein MntB [Austwickia sp. TVS 96-490-7B]
MTVPDLTGAGPCLPPVIELRSASFGYAGRTVVNGVTLMVTRGESVALLGPNGCGKSTLVKGLLGLNDHMGGEVLVFGEPLRSLQRRSRIGYVPQRHTVSSSVAATVSEVVMIGRLPHLRVWRRPGKADRAVVERSLDLVGLSGMAKADVSHLSGGQQRRVLVARALAAEPEVLIMDEPTAGVDESNQAMLAEAMHSLAAEGVTLVTVTHGLESMADAVSRVVVMRGGSIVADGAPSEVLVTGTPPTHHVSEGPVPGGAVLQELRLDGAADV